MKNEICETLKLNNNQKEKNILTINLIENKPITNLTSLFSERKALISLPDIDKCDTKNVTDISIIIDSCSSLKSLPDISKWDTKNVKDMQ